MRNYIILLIWFYSSELSAQSKTIFFQIDSLKAFDQGESAYNFKIRVGNQGFANLGENFDSTRSISKSIPNFTNVIELENDSSTIEIPIDLNGSFITLKNLRSLNADTITIENWEIYNTQTLDTVYTIIEYYKKQNQYSG